MEPKQADPDSASNAATIPLEVIGRVTTMVSEARPHSVHGSIMEPGELLSKSRRVTIAVLIILCNLVQFISQFTTFAGGYKLTQILGKEVGPGQANWMPAAYALTQSAFVLVSGRLGAVYGHQNMLLLGASIITVFSLGNAFCKTYEAFITVRAMTGIGGGILMPNAVAILTIMVPPGRSRNVTLATFAASPPVGALIGALLAGLFLGIGEWKYMYIVIALLGALVSVGLFFVLPAEERVDQDGKIDYVGAALGISGLAFFNFSWNQAPSAGWQTPYCIVTLILAVLSFGLFIVWESSFTAEPIMPLSVFVAPTFTALIGVILLTYMAVGISLWYMVAWQQLVRNWTVMQIAIGWIPFSVGASMAVGLAAWLIPRLEAQYIMAIGIVSILASNLLLATQPEQQTYWAQTFPAIFIGSICPDFVYVAAQVIASNAVGKREQGVAGSLIGTLNLYGNSLGLGFVGTMETQLVKHGASPVRGYSASLYFGAALAVTALAVDLAYVRMPKDGREGWSSNSGSSDVMEESNAGGLGSRH